MSIRQCSALCLVPCALCPVGYYNLLTGFLSFWGHSTPLDIQRLFRRQYSALTIHYSYALFTLSDMNILFRAACTTNAVSSTFDFKGVICTVLPTAPSPISMCFSSYCTEVAEVLFIMSLANSLAREREIDSVRGRGSCSWRGVWQGMETVAIPFSARTCHCPPLTCPIELACNGQKKRGKTACNH